MSGTAGYTINGANRMEALGRRLAVRLTAPALVTLTGDLGAGKTTLVRGVLRGFGYHGLVTSPTFTLVESYRCGAVELFHFDLYRLHEPNELEFLGLRDCFGPASLVFVEWPEQAQGALPAADLAIRIGVADKGRVVTLHAGAGGIDISNLMEQLAEDS